MLKQVEGYTGYYVDDTGNVYKEVDGQLCKQSVKRGKIRFRADGKQCTLRVGRLVYQAIKGVKLSPTENVRHRDNDVSNNHIDNLYVTQCKYELDTDKDIYLLTGCEHHYFDEDGNIYNKVGDDYYIVKPDKAGVINVFKENKLYHLSAAKLIYETVYGAIEDGKVIIHKDGNKENYKVDNLICVSKMAASGKRIIVKFIKSKRMIPFSSITVFYNHMVNKYGYKYSLTKFRTDVKNNNIDDCIILKVEDRGKHYG